MRWSISGSADLCRGSGEVSFGATALSAFATAPTTATFAVMAAWGLASAVAAAFEAGLKAGCRGTCVEWTPGARRERGLIVGWSVGMYYRAAIEGRALLLSVGLVE
jgi:hypothetical protein